MRLGVSGPLARRGILSSLLIGAIIVFALLGTTQAQPGVWRSINAVNDNLNSVWMVDATHGWAVGESGASAYWDGASWRKIETGTGANLTSVSCATVTNCFAVGYTPGAPPVPTILHWDGLSWSPIPVPGAVKQLFGVYVLSDGTGFAVGFDTVGVAGKIVRLSGGTSWIDFLTIGTTALRSVFLLPPGSVGTPKGYAVGDASAAACPAPKTPTILHWDGTTIPGAGWTAQAVPSGPAADPGGCWTINLRSVYALSTSSAFAVGDQSSYYTWNGAAWTGPSVMPTGLGVSYNGLFMVSSTEGWIVSGNYPPVMSQTFILHFVSPVWSVYTNPPTTVRLRSVYMILPGGSDGWAVGEAGIMIRWNGSAWNTVTSPTGNVLGSVSMYPSGTDGWIVGDGGIILRWNGVYWNLYYTLPSGATLRAVHSQPGGEAWAVGCRPAVPCFGGGAVPPTILRFTGAAWAAIAPPGTVTGQDLLAVQGLSSSLAYAGGTGGNIIKWDGAIWGSICSGPPTCGIPGGTNINIFDIFVFSDNTDGWAAGVSVAGGPVLMRWNGLTWAPFAAPAGVTGLLALSFIDKNNGWAAGQTAAGGVTIHWDGTSWTIVPGPFAGKPLFAISMLLGGAQGWAMGCNEIICIPGVGVGNNLNFWDGVTWQTVLPIPTMLARDVYDLWMVSTTDGWAVGDGGLILRFGAFTSATFSLTTVFITTTKSTTSTLTSTSTVGLTTTVPTFTSTTTSTATLTSTTTSTVVSSVTSPPPPRVPIPGFPVEGIIAGLALGGLGLFGLRRRGRKRSET